MSELTQGHRSIAATAAAGGASFATLVGIFLYTMLLHDQAIDWPYLGFALVRISAISLAVAGVGYFFHRRLAIPAILLLGAVLGFIGGAVYVYAATA